MRFATCFLVLLAGVTPAFGQARTEARTGIASNVTQPKYRLVRTEGTKLLITEYEQDGDFYVVTDTNDKTSRHFIKSVKRIEPLTEAEIAEFDRQQDTSQAHSSSPTPRTTARVASPRTARTTARKSYSASGTGNSSRSETTASTAPPTQPTPPTQDAAAGTTATGIPLHVGPRGGVYHISKGGNKVYHSKKK